MRKVLYLNEIVRAADDFGSDRRELELD